MSVGYIENYITRAPYKDPTTVLVLVTLADCASPEGTLWYAVERLAARARISPRRFRVIIAKLEADGVVKRVERSGKTNLWHLRKFPEDMPEVDKPPAAVRTPVAHDTPDSSDRGTPVAHDSPPLSPTTAKPSMNRQCEPSSLLRAASGDAAGGVATAPRQSRADPKRVALTAALACYPQHFGMPRSRNELTLWNKRLTSLLAGGLTPADVPRAVNAWKRKYPSAQLTINALDLHLGELLPAPVIPSTPPQEEIPQDEPTHDAPTRQPIPLRTREEMERIRAEADERRRAATDRARAALAEANRRATDAEVVSRGQRLAAAPRAPLQM